MTRVVSHGARMFRMCIGAGGGFTGEDVILVRVIAIAVCLCAILVLPAAWDGYQGWIFPDATSYLDMAGNAVRDSPAVLLKNAYWSPAYPAILALTMAVARPSLATELRAVYIVNWLLFLVTTACFSLLLKTFLEWLRRTSWPELVSDSALFKSLVCFSYAFFLLSNMNHVLWYVTPDMLLQGLVYLSAALGLRLFLPDPSWKHSVALGLSLGLGYSTKAAMFPMALLFVALLFLRPPGDRLGRRHPAIALACFLLIAAPLVLSLSYEKHRLTFGDSGKLNYAFFVVGLGPYAGWTGQHAENGIPAHPPRTINGTPLVLEFRTPVSGTLPIWYDPSYWWEGLRNPISMQRQLAGLLRPFTTVHTTQTIFLALVAALPPLCLFNFRVRRVIREGGIQNWILILWPAAGCSMYLLVLFAFRFVVAYIVLICLGATALLLQPFKNAIRVRALLAASLLLAVVGAVRLGPILIAALRPHDSGSLTREEGMDNRASSAAVARELARFGVHPGDEIAVIGHSLDSYYARLAQVRIVAQIWDDPDRIAAMGGPEVRRILTQLKQAGVKALVSRANPGFVNDEGWIAIPRTDVYVRML